MIINREELLKQLESVLPGLSTREIIEQSSCFIFKDETVNTYNDEIACSQKSVLKIEGAVQALPFISLLRKLKEEELEKETEDFLRPYLKLSAEVLRVPKKAIMAGLMDDLEPSLQVIEDIYLNQLMKTHDANEGLKAFIEKRKPVWKNE